MYNCVATDRSKVQQGKKRMTSSSSSSSGGDSSSSDSSSEGTPERSRRINSPIRVSPERRDYKVHVYVHIWIVVCTAVRYSACELLIGCCIILGGAREPLLKMVLSLLMMK